MIKNVRAPYGEVGKLESSWTPLVLDAEGRAVDPEADEGCDVDLPEIESPQVLKKKTTLPPQTAKLPIAFVVGGRAEE